MKIFLTGGTGFFGKWLLKTLPAGFEATVLSRDPATFLAAFPEFKRTEIHFICGDIRNFDLSNDYFDYVIHAATTAAHAIPDEELNSVILEGTQKILTMNFGKMLYVSSGAVYGEQPPELECISEDYCGEPVNAYGRSKLMAEQLCLESGKPITIARCFAFVGPFLPLDAHFAIGNFIDDCLNNRPIIIKGDGMPLRSYLYATDLAEWLFAILNAGKVGRAYNVGSDQAISILQLAQRVRLIAGTDNQIEVLKPPKKELPPQKELPPRYVPNILRAQSELGLNVKIGLDEAIKKTFDWCRA